MQSLQGADVDSLHVKLRNSFTMPCHNFNIHEDGDECHVVDKMEAAERLRMRAEDSLADLVAWSVSVMARMHLLWSVLF